MSRVVCTIRLCNGWQWQVSSATSPPLFRLARKAVCSTMATSNVCRFIILSISVQTKKGMSEDSTHRKPLLCLVTSFIRAAGDRWMLVTRGTTRSESVFSMGSCPAQPIFSLNRVHKLTKIISLMFPQYHTPTTTNWNLKSRSMGASCFRTAT